MLERWWNYSVEARHSSRSASHTRSRSRQTRRLPSSAVGSCPFLARSSRYSFSLTMTCLPSCYTTGNLLPLTGPGRTRAGHACKNAWRWHGYTIQRPCRFPSSKQWPLSCRDNRYRSHIPWQTRSHFRCRRMALDGCKNRFAVPGFRSWYLHQVKYIQMSI